MEARLRRVAAVSGHLNSVSSTSAIREAYQKVVPLYSRFRSSLRANQELNAFLKEYAATAEADGLDPVRRRRLDSLLREFRRQGAELPDAERARLQEIYAELAELQNRFSENVLDATAAFELHLTDPADLAGLPEGAVEAARSAAAERGLTGRSEEHTSELQSRGHL